MVHWIKNTSYLNEGSHDICYQELIENYLFVSAITNKGKVAYIRTQNPP
jgi:hypothetical protein